MFHKLALLTISITLIITSFYIGILSRNALKKYAFIGITEEQRNSITVQGEGKVIGIPDTVTINIGLSTEDESINTAQNINSKTINTVINKLKNEIKLDKKNIKTTNYNINPRYDWKDGETILKGYIVSQNIKIKTTNLTKINKILQIAGEYNFNQVGDLNFSIDNKETLKQEARIIALKNAKQKAKSLADVMEVKLGKVLSFSEQSNSRSFPIMKSYATIEDSQINKIVPELEAGAETIKINATVEYEIH